MDEHGEESKVLARLGNVVLRSKSGNFDAVGYWQTFVSLEYFEFKLKDQPQEDVIELTLQEVADLKGVDVNKIRIKE